MGDIVPFLARVRASGDWTATERERLEALAERFSGVAEGVEVVFGCTDEGDPWCVVKDAQDEILVHVARIGGRFIIHYALDDALAEGADLPTLLAERLHWEAEEREDVVVPFSRQAQSLLALIIATAFYFETRHLDPEAPTYGDGRADGSRDQADPTGEPDPAFAFDFPAQMGGKAAAVGVLSALSWPSRSFASAPDPAPTAMRGAAGSDPLVGSPTAAEVIAAPVVLSGPESDARGAVATEVFPLRAATGPGDFEQTVTPTSPGGQGGEGGNGGVGGDSQPADPPDVEGFVGASSRQKLVEGTDGADRLSVEANVVAAGGGGADTFVLQAPERMGDATNRLGVIADFNVQEGDRLVTAAGHAPSVLNVSPTTTNLTAVPRVLQTADANTGNLVVNGRQVEVDLDGDGRSDGYVVMLYGTGAAGVVNSAPALAETPVLEGPPIMLTGQSLDHYEI